MIFVLLFAVKNWYYCLLCCYVHCFGNCQQFEHRDIFCMLLDVRILTFVRFVFLGLLFAFVCYQMAASSACLVGNGLSTSNAKRNLTKEFCGSHLYVSTRVPLCKTSRILTVKAVLDKRRHEGRRGFLKLLIGNLGIGGSTLLGGGKAFADDQGVSSSRMSYSRFLEYLDKDRVKKVDLFENTWDYKPDHDFITLGHQSDACVLHPCLNSGLRRHSYIDEWPL